MSGCTDIGARVQQTLNKPCVHRGRKSECRLDELVLKLLAAGKDINSAGPGGTCLVAAAFSGYETIVRLLLDKCADVNAVVLQTKDGHEEYYSPTAIMCAVETRCEDIVNILLVDGADGNICRTQRSKPVPRNAIIIPLEAVLTESHNRGVTQLQTLSREYQLRCQM